MKEWDTAMASATEPLGGPGDRMEDSAADSGPDRVLLTAETHQTLDAIARLRGGVSYAEVVRRALDTELFLIQAEKEGSRILLEDSDKTVRQIILR